MGEMTKEERLRATIQGQAVDRPPVALWRHFPGDDQRPEDLAAATVAFQRRYDFDFVKVTPASSFCLRDWGAQDRWVGNLEGTRDYVDYGAGSAPVQSPDDWPRDVLDPGQGALGAQLRCLRLIGDELAGEVPFIQTVFNPLSQAKNLVGAERLPVHVRRYPDAVRAGLDKRGGIHHVWTALRSARPGGGAGTVAQRAAPARRGRDVRPPGGLSGPGDQLARSRDPTDVSRGAASLWGGGVWWAGAVGWSGTGNPRPGASAGR